MTRARLRTEDELGLVAQAIANPTRLVLLRHIQAADGPVNVLALADRFGLHPNAVRQHLAHLRDADLVIEDLRREGAVGRPRLTYRANPERTSDLAGWNPYEALSQLLVQVAAGESPRVVGTAYGRRLAAAAPERSPTETLVSVARHHGFRPSVEVQGDSVELVLGRCPFAASVTADGLVCELHRGIAEGIVDSRDGAEVVALAIAPPLEGGCRFHLHLTDEGAST